MTDQAGGRPGGAPDGEPAPEASPAAASAAPDAAAPAATSAAAPAAAPSLPIAWPAPAPVAATVTTRTGSWFAGLDPRGWRTTVAAGVLMLATVLAANLVNAAVPLPEDPVAIVDPLPAIPGGGPAPVDPEDPAGPGDPADPGPVGPGDAVEVGGGLVLYPPAGWTVVSSEPGAVVLQKGGVVLLALTTAYDGDPAILADGYTEAFFATGQFQASSPETGTLGNGIPSVVISWAGIIDGGQYDGVIASGAASGTGMILNVVAPKGQLGGVADDLETIGESLQIAPGGE